MRVSAFAVGTVVLILPLTRAAETANVSAVSAAANSIEAVDLKRHVQALADDTFEGREAGSRGGRAASIYLGKEFQRHRLAGGANPGYYQAFGANYRNILGRLEGSDPALKHEVVILSAHYDHVGYGTASNSYGPTGYIHNGADDNASGVSGLLETLEAFAKLPAAPRRTVLFAFWDGEEKGLLGSKHWLSSPTVPLANVVCLINTDMIGRLRGEKLEVYGTRTAPGFRRLVTMQNRDADLLLDLTWEMADNSDHYPFYERGIPVLMMHTGLHGDYHRPSDDVERIGFDGMQRVSRLMFQTACELANQPGRPRFRQQSRMENGSSDPIQSLPALPTRLGVRFNANGPAGAGVEISTVEPDQPAQRAGLRPGDLIVRFGGQDVADIAALRKLVWAAASPVAVVVERSGAAEPVEVAVNLTGQPVRLGIAWRTDAAEPQSVILTRVVPGTAAAQAGLMVNDRIYEVGGQGFADVNQFRALLDQTEETIELTYERRGQVRSASVQMPRKAGPANPGA